MTNKGAISGTPTAPGTFNFTIQVRSGNTNYTIQASIVVTGEAPVVHGGIISSAIDEQGHLIVTYEDGTTADLGLVVGANGKDGVDGKDGKDGVNGKDGVDGKDGKDGANGQDGAQGPQGPAGEQGPAGPQGPQGPQGPAGEAAPAQQGCGGSIAAASGIMALIAGLGLAVVAAKKSSRKED